MGYFIKKRELNRFLDKLIAKHLVVAPVKKDIHRYEPIKSSREVNLNFVNSKYPLKKYFLPFKETLFMFTDSKTSVPGSRKGAVLFAMRPCDVNALLRMDKLFLDECPDPYYAERRKNNIIIALTCTKAGDNCFCTSFGTQRLDSGYDLLFTETKGGYVVQVGSQKGKALLDKKLFKETSLLPEVNLVCSRKLDESQLAKLKDSFYHDLWKQEAEKCLSCSACTMTCPTCGCFRVLDMPNIDAKSGCRNREWTSCQLRNFTVVAGGFSFREDRSMRLKNRIYHQLDYFKDKFGIQMCVGCGRCIANCPTNIDMTEIIPRL
jgi:sulfhydrogenase subunit beta (sulfur reductase)